MKKTLIVISVIFAMGVLGDILSSQQTNQDDTSFGWWGPYGEAKMGMMRDKMMGPGFGPKAMAGRMMRGGGLAETEAKVIDIVSKNDPQFASKLNELKKNFPHKYNHMIRVASNLLELSDDNELVEKDIVRGMALEFDTRELALKYVRSSNGEKEKIKSEIRSKLNELFDIRTKIQELRIKRLESRIKNLKLDVEKRKQNKSKIVEDRLNELCGDRSLRW